MITKEYLHNLFYTFLVIALAGKVEEEEIKEISITLAKIASNAIEIERRDDDS